MMMMMIDAVVDVDGTASEPRRDSDVERYVIIGAIGYRLRHPSMTTSGL